MRATSALAELLVRYLRGHGPATLADFRWWAGLPQGLARAAREGGADRIAEIDDGVFVETGAELVARPAAAPADILALPPFDEYYLSYADRTLVCGPVLAAAIGPTRNGAVSPVLMDASGVVVGTWRHSLAVGRHHLAPIAEVAAPDVDETAVTAALERFRAFLGA
ncbi:DNA glycosylase AlkZ-like family protein [Microbacterium aurum]